MMVAGLMIILKSEWMINNFGRIGFFEDKLGTEGGTRLGYKLIGLAVIFLGLLAVTNMIGGFIEWVFSPLLKYQQ